MYSEYSPLNKLLAAARVVTSYSAYVNSVLSRKHYGKTKKYR